MRRLLCVVLSALLVVLSTQPSYCHTTLCGRLELLEATTKESYVSPSFSLTATVTSVNHKHDYFYYYFYYFLYYCLYSCNCLYYW